MEVSSTEALEVRVQYLSSQLITDHARVAPCLAGVTGRETYIPAPEGWTLPQRCTSEA